MIPAQELLVPAIAILPIVLASKAGRYRKQIARQLHKHYYTNHA